ncbi:MAG: glycosyltransferase family 2 protein [Rhodospirillaceae bacterium]|jgi:polyisoprenyl-phosphate glycosyltransferase|nr:glycosyltransferase family 2 protein [Rhodospirillaceae bacterium]MBT5192666.1 glycosyltransferase family 2 protein [Rhodospirillaceae bacterium]MBT5896461.1 glycosyltransferase family 2 protein [Rhodospirillaceae bacterium]MBT6430630.1 glycosyltransferase family 2 protein [Rhodospirillaceae bacterium]
MTNSPNPVDISVVVPVYQEEDCIKAFIERATPTLEAIGGYEIIFCMDPSPDRTEEIIREEALRNSAVKLVTFSRRFGQPEATMAGVLNASGKAVVVIDVDLQDPPELIAEMYEKLGQGYDVVYAKRRSRSDTSWSAKLVRNPLYFVGYKVIAALSETDIPRNTGDFRILSRRVIEELRYLPEGHGFLRGLVAFVGYKQTAVFFDRVERSLGTSKYNQFWGSFKIAFNGLFGFSTAPLSLLLWLGVAICFASFIFILVMVFKTLVLGQVYPLGIPTITVLILFLGGVQLAAIGVLGEYIGRIYNDVRRRPLYIIDDAVNLELRAPFGPTARL